MRGARRLGVRGARRVWVRGWVEEGIVGRGELWVCVAGGWVRVVEHGDGKEDGGYGREGT